MCFQVHNGATPQVSEILAVRRLFSGPPLGIKRMRVNHMVSEAASLSSLTSCTNDPELISPLSVVRVNQRHISPLLFLTPRLPGFLVGRRLNSHALELLQLDRALCSLGPHQLTDAELREVSRSRQT